MKVKVERGGGGNTFSNDDNNNKKKSRNTSKDTQTNNQKKKKKRRLFSKPTLDPYGVRQLNYILKKKKDDELRSNPRKEELNEKTRSHGRGEHH